MRVEGDCSNNCFVVEAKSAAASVPAVGRAPFNPSASRTAGACDLSSRARAGWRRGRGDLIDERVAEGAEAFGIHCERRLPVASVGFGGVHGGSMQ